MMSVLFMRHAVMPFLRVGPDVDKCSDGVVSPSERNILQNYYIYFTLQHCFIR